MQRLTLFYTHFGLFDTLGSTSTNAIRNTIACTYNRLDQYTQLGLWLRLECSLDSLSIDSAHVIYVSEGYDVAYNRRTASQPSHVVLRVTWYVKTFQKRQLRVLNPARINVFYWFNWLNLIGS